jgi:hypothetical protein
VPVVDLRQAAARTLLAGKIVHTLLLSRPSFTLDTSFGEPGFLR